MTKRKYRRRRIKVDARRLGVGGGGELMTSNTKNTCPQRSGGCVSVHYSINKNFVAPTTGDTA
jgi:hypothetical protein